MPMKDHCFFVAYRGRIANCIPALASIIFEAAQRQARQRFMSYAGSRQAKILKRPLKQTISIDNCGRFYSTIENLVLWARSETVGCAVNICGLE